MGETRRTCSGEEVSKAMLSKWAMKGGRPKGSGKKER
jgi:hypothetical protein